MLFAIGSSRAVLQEEFPMLDFSGCEVEWRYEAHTHGVTRRAERVRRRLFEATAQNIVVVTHRGFIAHLVEWDIFENCEIGSYEFVDAEEAERVRMGVDPDRRPTDYGPTVLRRTGGCKIDRTSLNKENK